MSSTATRCAEARVADQKGDAAWAPILVIVAIALGLITIVANLADLLSLDFRALIVIL